MFTLMKSEQTKAWNGSNGPPAYEQKGVAEYGTFDAAVAACEKANRELKDRHYVMNDSGKESYEDTWID
jgi:hypothetical protein